MRSATFILCFTVVVLVQLTAKFRIRRATLSESKHTHTHTKRQEEDKSDMTEDDSEKLPTRLPIPSNMVVAIVAMHSGRTLARVSARTAPDMARI